MSLEKQEEDYTAAVDEALPVAIIQAQNGQLVEAIESLLPLEKKARTAYDVSSTTRVLQCIVEMCIEAQQWTLLNDYLIALSKRRGQLKQSLSKMVQSAIDALDRTPSKDVLLSLIDTIRTITSGKIHVENERARVTVRLSKIREEDNDINQAADILHELQVETYGSMERREKIEIILEQMRLALAKADFIRTQILSKKISTKFFKEENTDALKLAYYKYMLLIAEHETNYLDMCTYHQAIYDTPSIQADHTLKTDTLRDMVVFVILAPHGNQQHDLLHKISQEKHLSELPLYNELIGQFKTNEVMAFGDVETSYSAVLRATPAFDPSTDLGNKKWTDFRSRVVEHNLRVIAKYYTKITTKRLVQLLGLDQSEVEEFITTLVVNKTIFAKIDRLAGVVTFTPPPTPDSILIDWSNSTKELMDVVDKTTHLISKERMVHKV